MRAFAHVRSRFPFTPLVLAVACACLCVAAGAGRADTVVFSTDFESGLPPQFTAPGVSLVPVQGFAGLGHDAYTFGGQFLRYDLQGIQDTKLVVHGLPPHDRLDLGFLLGIIDSWDGVELMQVLVDGDLRFSHWFQIATGDTSDYLAPPGGVLSRGAELGFSLGSYYGRDRAYDLSLEPAFRDLPHTADSVVVVWRLNAIPGGGANYWQGGMDESWAIDGVRVTVRQSTADAPGAVRGALALSAPAPNPSRSGALRVRLSLAGHAPATLELLDVQGRVRRAERWASPAPGATTVDLSRGDALAPGVYFVRLTQAAESRTARVLVVE